MVLEIVFGSKPTGSAIELSSKGKRTGSDPVNLGSNPSSSSIYPVALTGKAARL